MAGDTRFQRAVTTCRETTISEFVARGQCILNPRGNFGWVGLVTLKRDIAVLKLAGPIPVRNLALDAAVDALGASVNQAPTWMQRFGLEWVYRFLKEPTRLAGRKLCGIPVVLSEVACQRPTR